MTSGLVAYASQSWRIIWWYGAVLNATICPMWIFLNESPRWLLSKGKYAKAERSMEFAAKLNKTELPPKVAAELVAAAKERNTAVAARKKAGKGGSTMRFYRSCIIWKNLLTVFFGWFATMMVHFGLIRRSVNLGMGGNIYTNFILMDSTELVAIIISMFTINRYGHERMGTFLLIQMNSALGWDGVRCWPRAPVSEAFSSYSLKWLTSSTKRVWNSPFS